MGRYVTKILWTPTFLDGFEFKVHLDQNFARQMSDTSRVDNGQVAMNQIAKQELAGLGFSWNNAYTFYRNSCLVSQISLGHNGVNLSVDEEAIQRLEPAPSRSIFPLQYHSSNVGDPSQAHALMRLFDKWAFYADSLSGTR